LLIPAMSPTVIPVRLGQARDLQPHVAEALAERLVRMLSPPQSAHGPAWGSGGLAVVGLAPSLLAVSLPNLPKGEQLDQRAPGSDA